MSIDVNKPIPTDQTSTAIRKVCIKTASGVFPVFTEV